MQESEPRNTTQKVRVQCRQDFIVQKLNNDALAAVLREVVSQLQYYQCCEEEGVEDMVVDARVLYDLANELEELND